MTEFLMADLTLSRDSWTAASGRPTMVRLGSPREVSTSTSTMAPSRPTTAQLVTLASMPYLPSTLTHPCCCYSLVMTGKYTCVMVGEYSGVVVGVEVAVGVAVQGRVGVAVAVGVLVAVEVAVGVTVGS